MGSKPRVLLPEHYRDSGMTERSKPRKINLTKAAIEALKPEPGKFYTVNDTKQVGLCVRVMASGAKYFVAYRKVDGRPERKTIGRVTEVTVEQARTHVMKLGSSIADGKNPFDERKKKREEMTVGVLVQRFIEEYCKPRNLTWKKAEKMYEAHLKEHWHTKKVSEIDSVEIQDRFQKIGKDTPIQANRVLSMVSKMMVFAKKIGVGPEHNPAKGTEKYPETERQRYLSDDEVKRFAKALDAEPNQKIADFFRLALFVGVRRGNLLAMRKDQLHIWTDEDGVQRGRWSIPRTKNKKPLVVHLSAEALIVIERRLEESGDSPWIFPSYGASGHLVEPKKVWARVCKEAKLEDFRIHDVRHTFASELAKRGISLLLLGQAMGHLSHQSTKRYSHLNVDDVSVMIDQANADVGRKMNVVAAKNQHASETIEWDDCEGGVG